ncbi:MAG: hypothetical protein LC708_02105 [Actinobacteria bacterium]|nr:hypothetical protein [Actinomycetota bacterium]
MRAPAAATRIGRGRLRRLALASAVVAVLAGIGAGVASAYWLTTDSSDPAVALADRVLTGPRPSLVGIDGQDVTVSWPASTTAAGQPVLGYTVSRYASATGGTATAAGSGCAAVVATQSCTDANVAAGLWYYAVTPRIYNWAGPEGARSPAVVVAAPSLSLTAGQVVPNLPGTVSGGSIAHFKANEAVALRLDTATGTVLSATITTVDGAGQASGFTITIPATTSDGAHVVVAVGSGGSRATSNSFTVDTTAPTVVIDRVSKALLGPAATSEVVWHAEESGAYSVRVGGTDCSTGTEVAAATYTAAGQVTTTVTAGSLVEGPNTLRVCVVDASSHAGSATTTISLDTTSATGGSVTYRDGYYGSLLVAVTLLNGTDAVGGIAPSGHVLERAATTLANGSCASPFGAFSAVATDPPLSPSVYTDTAVASGNCYQYRYVVVDNASNTVTYATSAAARVDTTAPTFASPALTLTAGPNSFVSGTNVFNNPNLTSGFTIAAPDVTDPQSGVAKVNFPLIGGGVNGGGDQTAAPYTAAYTAAAGASASGSRSVTATNNALVTATAAFTLIPDGLVPAGGALAVNNGAATSGGSSSARS